MKFKVSFTKKCHNGTFIKQIIDLKANFNSNIELLLNTSEIVSGVRKNKNISKSFKFDKLIIEGV